MRIPSRQMPPAKRSSKLNQFLGASLLTGLLSLLAWASWLAAVALVTAHVILCWICARHSRRVAQERQDDSICSFARSFDCRAVDPWVIRAVYETYSEAFPIRADDELDAEEIDFDAITIAERTGRSLKNIEANPLFGQVATAGDLVRFVSHQPYTATSP